MPSHDSVIQAAGGIILRPGESGDQVLVIYRTRHKDWTFPKGKLEKGESFPEAAVREVREETGGVVRLGAYAGAIGYEVNSVPKVVLFWRMDMVQEGELKDHREVAEVRWMSISEALERLTHRYERDLLMRVVPSGRNSPKTIRPWIGNRQGLARLERELVITRAEIAFLKQRSRQAEDAWAHAAEDQLKNVREHLDRKDTEGGWSCLHSARRLSVFGLDSTEIADRVRMLREESQKLSSWRGKAILELLAQEPVTASRLAEALALRDEYASNQYHKIWLMRDQLGIVLAISLLALVLLLIALRFVPQSPPAWDFPLLAAVLLIGILGAGFSAAQSLISSSNESRIPERVANHYVTIARTFFGATAGLAGYVLYRSELVSIKIGSDGIGAALAIGFLFGYTGEKLVSRIAASVSGTK